MTFISFIQDFNFCKDCGEEFSRAREVLRHRESAHGCVMWACPRCPYVNDDKMILQNVHGKRAHRGVDIANNIYECSLMTTTETVCRSKPTMPSSIATCRRSYDNDDGGHKDSKVDGVDDMRKEAEKSKVKSKSGERNSVGKDRRDTSTHDKDSAGSKKHDRRGSDSRDRDGAGSVKHDRRGSGSQDRERYVDRESSRDKSTSGYNKDSAGRGHKERGRSRRRDSHSGERGRRSDSRDAYERQVSGTVYGKIASVGNKSSISVAADTLPSKSVTTSYSYHKAGGSSSSSKRPHCTDLKETDSISKIGKSEKHSSSTVRSTKSHSPVLASTSFAGDESQQQRKVVLSTLKKSEIELFPQPPIKINSSKGGQSLSGQESYAHPIGPVSSSGSSSESEDSLGEEPSVHVDPVDAANVNVLPPRTAAPVEQQEPQDNGKILASENRVRIVYPDGREVIHSSQEWLPAERFRERQLPVSATLTCPLIPPSAPSQAQVARLHEWLGGAIYYPPLKRQRAPSKKVEAGDTKTIAGYMRVYMGCCH